jgi:hypothetical protein
MGIFSSFKDNLSSFSGEQIIKKAVERYGVLQDFKINSSLKTMYLKVLLMGEKEPVEINIDKYTVTDEYGSTYVKVYDVKTSRPWMTRLAEDFLTKEKFEIPENYSSIAKKFL